MWNALPPNERFYEETRGMSGTIGLCRILSDDSRVSLGLQLFHMNRVNRPTTAAVIIEFEVIPRRWLLANNSFTWKPFVKIACFQQPLATSFRGGLDHIELEFSFTPIEQFSFTPRGVIGLAIDDGEFESFFDRQNLVVGLSLRHSVRNLSSDLITKVFPFRQTEMESFDTEDLPQKLEIAAPENFFERLNEITWNLAMTLQLSNLLLMSILFLSAFLTYIFLMRLQARLENPTYRKFISLLQGILSPFFINTITLVGLHILWNLIYRRDIFYKGKALQKLIDNAHLTSHKEPKQIVIYGQNILPGLSVFFLHLRPF